MSVLSRFSSSLRSLWQWFWRQSLPLKLMIAAVIIAGSWYGYSRLKVNSQQSVQYQTAVAEKGTLVVSVTASGQVSTANSASITTQASGVVKKVLVKNGQIVKAGAPIAEIELDRSAQQKYAQALSSYQSAKNSLDSATATLWTLQSKMFAANQKLITDAVARDLAKGDPTYIQQDADWLASEANYKNQQNVIAQARTATNNTWLSLQQSSPTIYAPISGTVTGLSLQVGAVISSQNDSSSDTTSSSNKVASITTTASPTVSVNLTEIDAPKVKLGDKATITFDAFSDKTFTGEVVSIDTTGVVSSGVTTYPVVIKLDVDNTDILPNMSATANIITDTKTDALLVPSSAVQTANGQSSVQVLKNGQPNSLTVETGLASDTQVEITSGLNEGDQVITNTVAGSNGTTSSSRSNSPFSSFGGSRAAFR